MTTMTLTINGHQCDHCGETEPGIRLPDSWEETYVPASAEDVWDGESATFCGSCSTARSLIQEALADDDYDGGDTFRQLSFRWDRVLSNEESEALYHYEAHS